MAKNAQLLDIASDRRGTVAMLFGFSALPLFGVVAMAVETGGVALESAEFGAWVEEACARSNSVFFASQDIASRVNAADRVLAARTADATNLPGDFSYSVNAVAGAVEVRMSGTQSGILGELASRYDIVVDCSGSATGSPIVFVENFEGTPVSSGWSWEVFASYPNWTVDGYGPQIIVGGVDGIHPPAYEGSQYVELDSNWFTGGTGLQESSGSPAPDPGQASRLNSSIERLEYLEAGTYELSFASRKKIFFMLPTDYNIGVYFELATAPSYTTPPLTVVGGENNWAVHRHIVNVTTPGNYRIGFRAEGFATKFGGLLDDIRLERL